MTRLSLAIAIALSLLGGAASQSPNSINSNKQTITDQDQGEAMRLNTTIAELYKQGSFDKAIPLAERALEIERRQAPDGPRVAVALANLAELHFAKKDEGKAQSLFQQAAAIYDKNGIKSPAYSEVLERLAQFSFLKRNFENSITLLERSLAIREQAFPGDSSQVARTVHKLAIIYEANHQYEKATPAYLRAIAIKERIEGRTHPSTVAALKDYACYRLQAQLTSAVVKKKKKDMTESEAADQSLTQRAYCWLFGFQDDCDQVSFDPSSYTHVLNGEARRLVQPPYPSGALEKHITGTAFVGVRIDERGDVVEAKAVCGGYADLNTAGVEAARASKFSPTLVDGQAVRVFGTIVYRFMAK